MMQENVGDEGLSSDVDTSETLDVKLTTQSFREAGGREMFPNLEIGGIVAGQLLESYAYAYAVLKLNDILIQSARRKEYSHIFDIKYFTDQQLAQHSSNSSAVHTAIGTGYRPKEFLEESCA